MLLCHKNGFEYENTSMVQEMKDETIIEELDITLKSNQRCILPSI